MKFISITKPGIIFGNLVSVLGGFFLGTAGNSLDFSLLLFTLLGMSLVIASGCVFNNVIDKDIDKLMERTQRRVMPQNRLSPITAIFYGFALGILGFLVLYSKTNLLTVYIALTGIVVYVLVYSLWFKRHSLYGTAVGGIAGAVPPVAGYCAVTQRLDTGALILFLMLFFWQLPHFYAISLYRLKDFTAANIPILPLKKSIYYTKISMIFFIIIFTLVSLLPTVFHYTHWVYFFTALLLGIIWLIIALQGLQDKQNQHIKTWSRKVFFMSIIIITLLCFLMRG